MEILSSKSATIDVVQPQTTATPWLMLISRSGLFLFFQALFAVVYLFIGSQTAFYEAARWWPLMALLTNIVSIILLVRLIRAEGGRYIDLLRFSRITYRKDLLWMLGSLVIGLPIAGAPMTSLAAALFSDPNIPTEMMFRPLPGWALAASILFPLTIAFAELPTYFGYVMPRLARQTGNGWLAWLLAAFFLGAQHCFLPLILDGRFFLWRLGMFLPFALFVGFLLKIRPGLMPYLAIIHALADFSTLAMYWMVL